MEIGIAYSFIIYSFISFISGNSAHIPKKKLCNLPEKTKQVHNHKQRQCRSKN